SCQRCNSATRSRSADSPECASATSLPLHLMSGGHSVRVARVYSQPEPGDGRRVLVDRLWPRGFRKDDPRIDTWLPKVAPSTELRHWYAHKPERFNEFAARYAG